MNSLPSSVNYAEAITSIPEITTKYSVALQSVNGQSFRMSGQQIIFQFPNRGYLLPDSVYLRYKKVVADAKPHLICWVVLFLLHFKD